MHAPIFLALLARAFLNALWNSLLKIKADPAVAKTMLAIGGGVALGILLLREPPRLSRILGAMVVCADVVIIKTA